MTLEEHDNVINTAKDNSTTVASDLRDRTMEDLHPKWD